MATDNSDGTIEQLKNENETLKAAIEDLKSRLQTAEALLANLPAGHTLTGEEIGAGMKATVKRVRRLED